MQMDGRHQGNSNLERGVLGFVAISWENKGCSLGSTMGNQRPTEPFVFALVLRWKRLHTFYWLQHCGFHTHGGCMTVEYPENHAYMHFEIVVGLKNYGSSWYQLLGRKHFFILTRP